MAMALGVLPGAATGACACGFGVKTHAKPTLQPTTTSDARLSPQSPVTYPNHPAERQRNESNWNDCNEHYNISSD